MRRSISTALMVVAVAATALAWVAPASAAHQRSPGSKLSRFRSCQQVNSYARHHPVALRRTNGVYSYGVDVAPTPGATTPGGAGGGAPSTGTTSPTTAPTSQAGTNVQEAGVDEPDIVKSEGSTVFAVAQGQLNAIDASGDTPKLLDSIPLPGGSSYGYGAQLLISGDRALVIDQPSFYYPTGPGPIPLLYPYRAAGTLLAEIDLSDPSAMKVLETMKIEGSYVSARLTGSTARVVIASTPQYPAGPDQPAASGPVQGGSGTTGAPGTVNPSTPAAHRNVRSHGPRWLPTGTIHDRQSGQTTARPLTPCAAIDYPTIFSGLDTLSVLTIDLPKGLQPVDSTAVMSGGEIVYASQDALYVATEKWVTQSADAQALSDVSTQIHQFDTSKPDATPYVASGDVPGFMLSQWSMSEQDGFLRVASTTSPPWDETGQTAKSQSFVTVLKPQGDQLAQAGQLGGLGTNENIYAVRFIGDTGYVVTFHQVDPLHILDLTDPTNPKVVGHLELPGYSSYLHPVGDGLLLGVGQAVSSQGRTLGTQLSLFDVSDLSKPTLIDQKLVAPGAYSEAESDHHAFTYWAPTGLAVLPVYYYDQNTGNAQFDGAIGYHIGPGGITEVGRITHGKPGEGIDIRRSMVVDGRLLTMSDQKLASSNLDTLSPLGETSFPTPPAPAN